MKSKASLSSHIFTLNACMQNNQSSGFCPKCCYFQSKSPPPPAQIIVFMIDHHCHGRVIEYTIAVAHPYNLYSFIEKTRYKSVHKSSVPDSYTLLLLSSLKVIAHGVRNFCPKCSHVEKYIQPHITSITSKIFVCHKKIWIGFGCLRFSHP